MTAPRKDLATVELALRDLAAALTVDDDKDYSGHVLRSLSAAPTQPPAERQLRRLRLVTAVVAVALAAAVVALVPASRHAVAEWFSFGGVEIKPGPVPTEPTLTPLDPRGRHLGLGSPMSFDRAESVAGFRLREVTSLGRPDAVYVLGTRGDAVVSLVYTARPGLPAGDLTGVGAILTEIRGGGHPLLEKIIGHDSRATAVSVDGAQGVYISGPQELLLADGRDNVTDTQPRLAADSLIWQPDDITYRLEADLGQAAMLSLASTVR